MKNLSTLKTYLSLNVIAGLLVFAGMTLVLGEISEDVMNHEPLTQVDTQLSVWLHTNASHNLTLGFKIITALGSTEFAISLAAVVGLYLIKRKQFYWLLAVWLSVYGGMSLNRLLKAIFQRERPFFTDPFVTVTGYSFPSGHTMAATVLFGVLAVFLVIRLKHLPSKLLAIILAAVLIVLVAFSRMYLGAHYLSDVLAAMAEGLAWLSLCLTIVFSIWRCRHPSAVVNKNAG